MYPIVGEGGRSFFWCRNVACSQAEEGVLAPRAYRRARPSMCSGHCIIRQEAEVTLVDELSNVKRVGKRANKRLTSRHDTCRLQCGPEGAPSGCEGLALAPGLTPKLHRMQSSHAYLHVYYIAYYPWDGHVFGTFRLPYCIRLTDLRWRPDVIKGVVEP